MNFDKHDWGYLMYLAEKSGDWDLYEFAKRMKENDEKWEPKAPWEMRE